MVSSIDSNVFGAGLQHEVPSSNSTPAWKVIQAILSQVSMPLRKSFKFEVSPAAEVTIEERAGESYYVIWGDRIEPEIYKMKKRGVQNDWQQINSYSSLSYPHILSLWLSSSNRQTSQTLVIASMRPTIQRSVSTTSPQVTLAPSLHTFPSQQEIDTSLHNCSHTFASHDPTSRVFFLATLLLKLFLPYSFILRCSHSVIHVQWYLLHVQ